MAHIDLSKFVSGKNLSETEEQVLYYMVEHLDSVLKLGVRGVARANYTSTSTIMRLAKKMGHTGFIDLYYSLVSLTTNAQTSCAIDINSNFIKQFSNEMQVDEVSYGSICSLAQTLSKKDGVIFIYGCGFSSLMAEYLAKKMLVLGISCIYSDGADSIGVFENNLEHISLLVLFSRSGKSHHVLNRARTAHENGIPIASFTSDTADELPQLSTWVMRAQDDNVLDDQNMRPTLFFTRTMMLIEILIYEYYAANVKNNQLV